MRRNLLITSVLLFILVFCTQVVAQEHKLIFGHMGTTDTAYHAVAEFVAERVTELTNGNVKIEVYPNAELGDEQDLFEQVMMGVTDFTIVNPGVTVEFSQTMNFFNFPFLYSSREHWERVFTSPLVQKLSEREKEAGVMILG
ncbi:MAG TPA: TRAP transporter substrate-binding protein DctP, partial [Synergistales bacterium]|nr:TRAP transporter substrate-binding protein DctP [Synergistales bacterium]